MDKLKPCPYCASDDITIESVYIRHAVNGHTEYFGQCHNCGANGPNELGISRAQGMWNMRRTAFPVPASLVRAMNEGDGTYKP